jgi:probable rRNA maturation factor
VTVLEAEVVKSVRAPIAPAFVKEVLTRLVAVPEIAARLPEGTSTVAVRITSDRELRRLNRTYAQDDHATDVLSFAGWANHIGDVAVSWPMVVRQARDYGNPASTEVALLCVHGMLHLLGWDHQTPSERREMTRLTRAALKLSGLMLSRRRL